MAADMPTIVSTALTAVFATGVTLFLGLRKLRLDQRKQAQDESKLTAEIQKLQAETEKLRGDMDDTRKQSAAIGNALLDIEKAKLEAASSTRNQIYPQLLELVYRLRNSLRGAIEQNRRALEKQYRSHDHVDGASELGPELGLLTEDLYRFRAYIDDGTFEQLHRFKRIMQDANVFLNRSTRPDGIVEPLEQRMEIARDLGIDIEAVRRAVASRLAEEAAEDEAGEDEAAAGSEDGSDGEPGETWEEFELGNRLWREIQLARIAQTQPPLERIAIEAEDLYAAITRAIQKHFNSIVTKLGTEKS